MRNVLITGPSVEPVSVSEMRSFLRLAGVDLPTEEDTLIETLITAARQYFENKTKRALISQTWRLTFDQIPYDNSQDDWWDGTREGHVGMFSSQRRYIELSISPLLSVTSFKAYAQDDSSTTFTDYFVDTSSRPGRVALRNGSVWPTATRGVSNFEVDYVAGYGPAATDVPGDILLAIKQLVAHSYEKREPISEASGSELPLATRSIIKANSVVRL
jgi:hypothetical protein